MANYRRIVFDYWNGSTWSVNNNIDNMGTTNNHANAGTIHVDANDRIWLCYVRFNAGSFYVKLIEPGATTLSGEISASTGANVAANYPIGHPTEYVDAGIRRVVFPFRSSVSGTPLRWTAGSSATAPTWTSDLITSSAPEATNSNVGALINDSIEKLFSFHVRAADLSLYQANQSTVGGAFDTETLFAPELCR